MNRKQGFVPGIRHKENIAAETGLKKRSPKQVAATIKKEDDASKIASDGVRTDAEPQAAG